MEEAAKALRPAILSFQQTMSRVKQARAAAGAPTAPGVVLQYKKAEPKAAPPKRAAAVRASRPLAAAR
jgi:hypothetical protein